MRNRNIYIVSAFSFVVGCMITLSFTSLEVCNDIANSQQVSGEDDSVKFVVLIFSDPTNFDRRNATRNTWLKLKNALSSEVVHYFVVGVSTVTDTLRARLRNEQFQHNDLLMLPQLKDQYSSLSEKLLMSLKWVRHKFLHARHLLKCDDDSFVRIDKLYEELRLAKETSDNELATGLTKQSPGLYWGYFKGNAHVRVKGRWAEQDWFLCDRYLPYALGGGYVLSADIVEFISSNSNYLQLYNSEDVSVGVWTSPLAHIRRQHDERFDTEWSSRGCRDSYLIRHKQSIRDMEDMYGSLTRSSGAKLCESSISHRPSYKYNWNVLPSQCCDPNYT